MSEFRSKCIPATKLTMHFATYLDELAELPMRLISSTFEPMTRIAALEFINFADNAAWPETGAHCNSNHIGNDPHWAFRRKRQPERTLRPEILRAHLVRVQNWLTNSTADHEKRHAGLKGHVPHFRFEV